MFSRRSSLILFISLCSSSQVLAQSAAACSTNSIWLVLYNNLQVSPCVVLSQIGEPCNSGNPQISLPLNPGFVYSQAPSACYCNIEGYNLASACAGCQNPDNVNVTRGWPDVAGWEKGCNITSLPHYPFTNISSSVQIPLWATAPPADTFNLNITLGVAKTESSLNSLSSTPQQPTGSLSGTSTTSTPTNHPLAASKKTSVAGPAAGGVIGGLAVLSLAGFFVWWYLRRQRLTRGNVSHVDLGSGGGLSQHEMLQHNPTNPTVPVPWTFGATSGPNPSQSQSHIPTANRTDTSQGTSTYPLSSYPSAGSKQQMAFWTDSQTHLPLGAAAVPLPGTASRSGSRSGSHSEGQSVVGANDGGHRPPFEHVASSSSKTHLTQTQTTSNPRESSIQPTQESHDEDAVLIPRSQLDRMMSVLRSYDAPPAYQ